MKTMEALRFAGLIIIVIHAIVTVVHSAAHFGLQIFMSPWQNVYIVTVIIALPLIAGFLLARRASAGFLTLFLSMLGAFLFGGYYHFVAPGPDNVAWLLPHAWTVPFQLSATLLGITELVGVAVGMLGLTIRGGRTCY
jgi:hypothetical protein